MNVMTYQWGQKLLQRVKDFFIKLLGVKNIGFAVSVWMTIIGKLDGWQFVTVLVFWMGSNVIQKKIVEKVVEKVGR